MRRNLAIFAAAIALLALPGIVTAANAQVVAGRAIPGHGTLLVATSNQMTLYTFDNDVAGSGVSNCTGGCLANWPPLTIGGGDTPTGGTGVTGTLGTIVRSDTGATQVTYDGKPLYFFINDAAPGDTNGIYTNWRAITLAAAPSPTATAAASGEPGSTAQPVKATPPPTSTGGGTSLDGAVLAFLAVLVVAAVAIVLSIRRLAPARRR